MLSLHELLRIFLAVLMAAVIAYALTPIVRRLALRFGFVDVPRDARRMHKEAMPTIGGAAIFAAFILTVLVFADLTPQLKGILLGGFVMMVTGMIDDKYDLNAKLKLVIQILAALIPVSQGCVIGSLSNPFSFLGYDYISLGWAAYPITVIWIVALTNAVNFIDGLDGLSAGICAISCLFMVVIAVTLGQISDAFVMAALLGACLGFLPYNFNPAEIFMGDTGATFLGFTLAGISVSGLFKLYTTITLLVPCMVLAIPLADITFAFLRRIYHHVSPMQADRSHIHHRLIDSGLDQRKSVAVLYIAAAVMGVVSVVLANSGALKSLMVLATAAAIGIAAIAILLHSRKHNPDNSSHEDEGQSAPPPGA